MPTGYPKNPRSKVEGGLGPSENTQRLLASMREIEQRLAVERRKDKARIALLQFARRHDLHADDLRAVAKLLATRQKDGAPAFATMKPKHLPPEKSPAKGKVGKALRAARRKLGLSAADVGLKLGTSGATVSAWEVGARTPGDQYHAGLLAALKLPKGVLPNGMAVAS